MARIPSGATMPYPPNWSRTAGDLGTATARLLDARHQYLGYLNLTPRQGGETLSDWASFRLSHNADDEDHNVRKLAAGTNLRFRSGRGACVQDAYTTKSGTQFVELACLVDGSRASSVIVGAAPPQRWAQMSSTIERAISAFTT